MRISEDRYDRDLRRLKLARRLIHEEVRTQWITDLTGLSDKRIRNLFHSYDKEAGCIKRRRGPSPTALASFLRSPLRSEASAIGGLARALSIIPPEGTSSRRPPPLGLETGERWMDAFDLFKKVVPQAQLKMDEFITLIGALSEGEELQLAHCRSCHGTLVVDPLGITARTCPACEWDSCPNRSASRRRPCNSIETPSCSAPTDGSDTHIPYQRSLFGEDE